MVELCRNQRAFDNFRNNRRAEEASIHKLQTFLNGPFQTEPKPTQTLPKKAVSVRQRNQAHITRTIQARLVAQDKIVLRKLGHEKLSPAWKKYARARGLIQSA